MDPGNPGLVTDVDFGAIAAGSAPLVQTFQIFNAGVEDLEIDSILSNDPRIMIDGPAPGTLLTSGAGQTLQLTLDPTTVGSVAGIISINSNSPGGVYELAGTGNVQSTGADIAVSATNNNAGGQKIGAGAKVINDVITISNTGLQDLVITSIAGSSAFSLSGLPAVPSVGTPLTLAPGTSIDAGLSFDPSVTGLQVGAFTFISNDADGASFTFNVTGTGLADVGTALDYGNDFITLEAVDNPTAPTLHTVSDASGNWSLFLPNSQADRKSVV